MIYIYIYIHRCSFILRFAKHRVILSFELQRLGGSSNNEAFSGVSYSSFIIKVPAGQSVGVDIEELHVSTLFVRQIKAVFFSHSNCIRLRGATVCLRTELSPLLAVESWVGQQVRSLGDFSIASHLPDCYGM